MVAALALDRLAVLILIGHLNGWNLPERMDSSVSFAIFFTSSGMLV